MVCLWYYIRVKLKEEKNVWRRLFLSNEQHKQAIPNVIFQL